MLAAVSLRARMSIYRPLRGDVVVRDRASEPFLRAPDVRQPLGDLFGGRRQACLRRVDVLQLLDRFGRLVRDAFDAAAHRVVFARRACCSSNRRLVSAASPLSDPSVPPAARGSGAVRSGASSAPELADQRGERLRLAVAVVDGFEAARHRIIRACRSGRPAADDDARRRNNSICDRWPAVDSRSRLLPNTAYAPSRTPNGPIYLLAAGDERVVGAPVTRARSLTCVSACCRSSTAPWLASTPSAHCSRRAGRLRESRSTLAPRAVSCESRAREPLHRPLDRCRWSSGAPSRVRRSPPAGPSRGRRARSARADSLSGRAP